MEVVESERGANYIKNLHEVHAVFRRIKTSFDEATSAAPSSADCSRRDLEVKLESVEKHWASYKAALGGAGGGGAGLMDICGNASTPPEVSSDSTVASLVRNLLHVLKSKKGGQLAKKETSQHYPDVLLGAIVEIVNQAVVFYSFLC